MAVTEVSDDADVAVDVPDSPEPAETEDNRWIAASLGGLATALSLVLLIESRFFLSGDKQALFLPVTRDIGRRLLAGELAVIDPDLAAAGNYALNLQFGLYNPFQLVLAVVLSRIDDVVVAATLWSIGLLAVLCAGVCALLLRLRVPGGWAAAGAVGVSLAGYTLYQFAPSWIAALASLAWLPWWWRAWYGEPGIRSLLGLAGFGYLLVAAGWPFTWLAAAFIGIGLVAEEVVRRPRDGAGDATRAWLRTLAGRVVASLGGALAGAAGAVPLFAAYDYTTRVTEIADDGRFRPDLADLFSIASPTHSMYDTVPGDLPNEPFFFVAWFVVVLAWGVSWSGTAFRVPGVLSAAVATVLATLATQLPALMGPLRQGLRHLSAFQLCVVVLVVVAYAHRPAPWTRGRVLGAVATAVVTGYLAWGQDPQSPHVIDGALLVLGCVIALIVLIALPQLDRWARRWPTLDRGGGLPAVFALVTTVLLTGWMVHAYPYASGFPHGLTNPPPTRAPGVVSGGPTLTIYRADVDIATRQQLYREGIGYGYTRLSAAYRPLNGVSSIGQLHLNRALCLTWYGYGCPDMAERLMATEPITGRRWIDLLGVEQVQVAPGQPTLAWRRAAGDDWLPATQVGGVTVYRRATELPVIGRITHIAGPAVVTPLDLGNAEQSYRVEAGDQDTRLVFRDIYWPGYTATLDGDPLAVTAVAEAFVSVTIPADASGELVVSYSPAGGNAMVVLWVMGGLLVLGSVLLVARRPE